MGARGLEGFFWAGQLYPPSKPQTAAEAPVELWSNATLLETRHPAMPDMRYKNGIVTPGRRTLWLYSRYFARVHNEVTALNKWITPVRNAEAPGQTGNHSFIVMRLSLE